MKKVLSVVLVAVFVLCSISAAKASTGDSDLKALAEKAVAYYKANGKEKAMAEFNNQKGAFVKGDLYVVVIDFEGIVLAHGGTPGLTGNSLYDQKDPNTEKYFVREMIDAARSTSGTGWVNYDWVNPTTKKIQPERSWIKRIENTESFVICGVFQ
jgi:signal transduction histidine kinase